VWYLRIRSFWTSEEDYSELIGLVDDVLTFIQAFRPSAWIVDLRNNDGGFAEAAAIVASRLGFSATFAEKVDRQGSASTIIAETDWRAAATSAVVVLVNQHTASAAEVFAATLQDSGRGHVIGEPTKGSVRSSKPFEVAGGALSISTRLTYAGPNRRSVDKVGVAPDEVVSLDAESLMQVKILGQFRSDYGGQLQSDPMASQYDSQLQAALDYVRALLGR
jgi:carboxyl-terminal processing protease